MVENPEQTAGPDFFRVLTQHCPNHGLASPAPFLVTPSDSPRCFRVTVIGDARIDILTALSQRRFTELSSDHHETTTITTHVGGTAMSFAEAAVAHFAEVRVMAAVGDDSWTNDIESTCAELGIVACLDRVPGVANAMVVIVRDAGVPDAPLGVRLLVAQAPSPYDHLEEELVRRFDTMIADADALVIDGYAMLSEHSAAAVEVATRIAHAAGVPICFDLVPHHIDAQLAWDDLLPIMTRSSLLIAEVPTLARLLGRTDLAGDTLADALAVAKLLPASVAGPRRTWFLRFGVGLMDETLAISTDHHQVMYHTGYQSATHAAGYGYRVAAAELKWWLTNAATAPGMAPILAKVGHVNISPEVVNAIPGRR